jgi:putative acetyltransferase
MIQLVRTDSENKDFIALVTYLDTELAERDGNDHVFYSQFNKIDTIKFAVIAYENEYPLGCGAIKQYGPNTMEIKRMYVTPVNRGKGIAVAILSELERWAAEMRYAKCVLETGKRQSEAINLYSKAGYDRIPNYGQYVGIENSICFGKQIG